MLNIYSSQISNFLIISPETILNLWLIGKPQLKREKYAFDDRCQTLTVR